MAPPITVTPEVFAQVKQLLNTGLFKQKQISQMTGVSETSISTIKRAEDVEEMRAIQKAALELSNKRIVDRRDREQEAKKAFKKAQEEVKQEKSDVDKFDNPELKMDIMIEKLDNIIELLKQVRIAQSEPKGIPMPGPKAPY